MADPIPSTEWRAYLRLGMIGPDVAAWRTILALSGYALEGPEDVFTPSVHNATVAWQRARELTADGIVGLKTRDAIGTGAATRSPPVFDPTRIPYLEAANWSRSIGPQPKRLIVLHSIEAPEASTLAENTAAWFAGQRGAPPNTSAHYCVDDDSIVCCVRPELIAWHAPGANQYGIGIEHAGYARQSRAEWQDTFSTRMLGLSAQLTAWLCKRFAIPVVELGPRELVAEKSGITTHAAVTKAWGKSTHTDPGPDFPMARYLSLVLAG
jgi:peptidoglycan hydrolase-like protein with peptidoglycan-binding domain